MKFRVTYYVIFCKKGIDDLAQYYLAKAGILAARRIKPIQVWFKSRAWYLKGYCLAKREMRLYKVSRIKNLTVTNETFDECDVRAVPETQDYQSYEGQHTVEIKLRIAPEKAYRVFDDFYESMVEKQSDGSFIVTVSWPEDDWLYGFLLSFGEHMEVLEPERIRAAIKEEAQKISKKY